MNSSHRSAQRTTQRPANQPDVDSANPAHGTAQGTWGHRSAILAAVATCALFTGCSNLTELAAEEGVERALEAETGEDIDIDFDFDDDGSFSLDTEDGSFSLNEDGTFRITDDNGEVFTGESNDGGFSVTGDEFEFDFNASADGGEVSSSVDWPTDVPLPNNITIQQTSSLVIDGVHATQLIASSTADATAVAIEFEALLRDAGFVRSSNVENVSGDAVDFFQTYDGNGLNLLISVAQSAGTETVVHVTVEKPA